MELAWGILVLVLSLIAWLGQLTSWLAPATALRLTLIESEADVEPVYWADIRGEAMWDSLVLWMLPLAALLLILDEPAWAVFGLVGGGAYLYYAGRGIVTRLAIQRRGFRIGASQNVRLGYAFLAVWSAMALITMVGAAASLSVL
jgi:hypothetical protein